jgi:tripartite-type tricarboxylate transporter receptor subunit TctC
LSAIVKGKDMASYLEAQGAMASGISCEALRKFIVEDSAKWKRVAEAAGIQPE